MKEMVLALSKNFSELVEFAKLALTSQNSNAVTSVSSVSGSVTLYPPLVEDEKISDVASLLVDSDIKTPVVAPKIPDSVSSAPSLENAVVDDIQKPVEDSQDSDASQVDIQPTPEEELNELTTIEVKNLCTENGIPSSGGKGTCIKRLIDAGYPNVEKKDKTAKKDLKSDSKTVDKKVAEPAPKKNGRLQFVPKPKYNGPYPPTGGPDCYSYFMEQPYEELIDIANDSAFDIFDFEGDIPETKEELVEMFMVRQEELWNRKLDRNLLKSENKVAPEPEEPKKEKASAKSSVKKVVAEQLDEDEEKDLLEVIFEDRDDLLCELLANLKISSTGGFEGRITRLQMFGLGVNKITMDEIKEFVSNRVAEQKAAVDEDTSESAVPVRGKPQVPDNSNIYRARPTPARDKVMKVIMRSPVEDLPDSDFAAFNAEFYTSAEQEKYGINAQAAEEDQEQYYRLALCRLVDDNGKQHDMDSEVLYSLHDYPAHCGHLLRILDDDNGLYCEVCGAEFDMPEDIKDATK